MKTTAMLPTRFRRHVHFALAALAAFAAFALATPAQAAPTRALASAAAPAPASEANGVVNLNTASEEELQRLPGVGPSKAAAIVAFRKKYGAFKKVDDLSKVKGFSYKTLKKLRPYLALSGATTYKGKAKKSAHGGPGADAPMTAEP